MLLLVARTPAGAQQQPKKKKKRFGLGDIIQGATGLPVGN